MKLSVAMCTYNGARYLQEQLASLAAQTRLPDEVVVCDDCSSDNTREILETFKAQAPFPVRLYFNETNLKVWSNFGKAIELCEGEIIALCDQDDVWHPEKLSLIESAFAAAPQAGMVFSDLEVMDETMRELGCRAWQCEGVEFGLREQRMFAQKKAFDVLLSRNVVTGCAMAFRGEFKRLLLPIPPSDTCLFHDYWIALVLSLVSEVAIIEKPLVKYRVHASQQIGFITPSASEFGSSRRQRRVPACRVEHLLERFLEDENRTLYPSVPALLKPILAHARAHERLPDKKIARRVLLVLRELVAGRYHLCAAPGSSGWRDVMIDLTPYKYR